MSLFNRSLRCLWHHWVCYSLGSIISVVWNSWYCTELVQILLFRSYTLHQVFAWSLCISRKLLWRTTTLSTWTPFFTLYTSQFTHFLIVTQSPLVRWWYPVVCLLPTSRLPVLLKTSLAYTNCSRFHCYMYLNDIKPSACVNSAKIEFLLLGLKPH